ncbi:hypothetical protein LCGC14_0819880 [marine sediment metagenome]|uniref:Uncharacterized protein n=1 Tax=marine sediment metagenome TaxID=412755 RepID=A0A0F9PNV3_9ZZZZ
MKTPFDDDIAAIEARRSDVHLRYALTILRGKRQGWLDAHEKLLPLIRGMRHMFNFAAVEYVLSDEEVALIKQVEEVVK